MPWDSDTFKGQTPNAIWDAPDARRSHLEAAACFRKAASYRRSYLLTVGQRRYIPLFNQLEVSRRYRRSGEHYAKVARLLERDLHVVQEMQRRNKAG